MHSSSLTGLIGDKQTSAQIIEPSGGGGNTFQIIVDNFFQGQLVLMQGQWRAYLAKGSWLQAEEIVMLLEAWEEKYSR